MEARIDTLGLLAQPKEGQRPELTENRTVWKSDNQGVEEETFIQTSRRDGNGQPGGEDVWQDDGWRTRASEVAAGRVHFMLGLILKYCLYLIFLFISKCNTYPSLP